MDGFGLGYGFGNQISTLERIWLPNQYPGTDLVTKSVIWTDLVKWGYIEVSEVLESVKVNYQVQIQTLQKTILKIFILYQKKNIF